MTDVPMPGHTWAMCCLCFKTFPLEQLRHDDRGLPLDVCEPCWATDQEVARRRGR